jgi:uncharacterized membrane protein YjfL (UPF0719 family)
MDLAFAKASALMLGINLLYAVIGFLLSVLAIFLIDKIFLKKLDLEEEIKKGNIAAAIFASALVIGAVLSISHALGK